MRSALSRTHRQWFISVLLVTLIVRALIPVGFMPATDRPFSFQICPDGFPAELLRSAAVDPHAAHHGGAADPDGAIHAHHNGTADHDGSIRAHHDGTSNHEGLIHAAHEANAGPTGLHPDADPTHRHESSNSQHCVFAAVAGAGPIAFVGTFSAVAVVLDTPEFFHATPAVESRRFRIQQPRGPPALS